MALKSNYTATVGDDDDEKEDTKKTYDGLFY